MDLKLVKSEELAKKGFKDEACDPNTYCKYEESRRTEPRQRITKADMLNVIAPLEPEQVLKVALWCFLLMDTADLRIALTAGYDTAYNKSDTAGKNQASKKLKILDVAANNSKKPRDDMLKALSDDSGWENVQSEPESVLSTRSKPWK